MWHNQGEYLGELYPCFTSQNAMLPIEVDKAVKAARQEQGPVRVETDISIASTVAERKQPVFIVGGTG
jgi:hypothetical protein